MRVIVISLVLVSFLSACSAKTTVVSSVKTPTSVPVVISVATGIVETAPVAPAPTTAISGTVETTTVPTPTATGTVDATVTPPPVGPTPTSN